MVLDSILDMTGTGYILLEGDVNPGESYPVKGSALRSLMDWRPRVREAVTVADAKGRLFRARILTLEKSRAELFVFEETGSLKEPFVQITLLQALPGKERMELIIQKTTELGVAYIIPFKSAKSISLAERETGQKKAHKWNDVALKASKQSRRAAIAEVLPYSTFAGALLSAKDAQLKIMLSEKRGLPLLKDLLAGVCVMEIGRPAKSAALLSGPEGGFSEEEHIEAEKAGFTPVSLGPWILRAETASIAALAIIFHELGV